MNTYVLFARLCNAGFALLFALTAPALSQVRNSPGAPLDITPKNQTTTNPSFDCRAARNSIERAICADVTLSEWDSRMGQLFLQALRIAKDRQALLQGQRLWLAQRDSTCTAVEDTEIWSCLLETTKSRATALARIAASPIEAAPMPQASAAPYATQRSNSESSSNSLAENPAQSISAKPPPSGTMSEDHTLKYLVVFLALAFGVPTALTISKNMHRRRLLAAEKERLEATYDEEVAARILAHEVWQGMTDAQLIESRGNPSDVGLEIIREKRRETWKYHQIGRNRFRERIYLENGVVIGWKN
jgi:uncharacterized protein